jgi:hypothetical protein
MSYQIIMGETSQTFEDIGDAAERARSLSLEFGGSSVKVYDAETGLVAFTVRPTTKDTK